MFLIVQNDQQCPAGSLYGLLTSGGRRFQTLAAYRGEPWPEASAVAAAVILGGEMGVHDTGLFPHLEGVRVFLAQALQAGIPLLGICLGGQLLAQVAGGRVASPSPHGEQGIGLVDLNEEGRSDPLFAGVPSPFVTFQLHGDSFTVPPGATLLAGSPVCPAQAFRVGRLAYGVQFHPEVDRSIVSVWGEACTPSRDFLSPFVAGEPQFTAASRTILANFLSLAQAAPRP